SGEVVVGVKSCSGSPGGVTTEERCTAWRARDSPDAGRGCDDITTCAWESHGGGIGTSESQVVVYGQGFVCKSGSRRPVSGSGRSVYRCDKDTGGIGGKRQDGVSTR